MAFIVNDESKQQKQQMSTFKALDLTSSFATHCTPLLCLWHYHTIYNLLIGALLFVQLYRLCVLDNAEVFQAIQ